TDRGMKASLRYPRKRTRKKRQREQREIDGKILSMRANRIHHIRNTNIFGSIIRHESQSNTTAAAKTPKRHQQSANTAPTIQSARGTPAKSDRDKQTRQSLAPPRCQSTNESHAARSGSNKTQRRFAHAPDAHRAPTIRPDRMRTRAQGFRDSRDNTPVPSIR